MRKRKETKVCTKCGIEKNKNEYHKKSSITGLVQPMCKVCSAEYKKSKYLNNREEEIKRSLEWRSRPENKERMKEYRKRKYWENRNELLCNNAKWRNSEEGKEYTKTHYKKYISDPLNKEKIKKQKREKYLKNREEVLRKQKEWNDKPENKESRKKYVQKNKIKLNARRMQRHNYRKDNDPAYIITRRLRFRLRTAIKSLGGEKYKRNSFSELVGCDKETLKVHIESKFKKGMTWANISDIHIDHIKPCSSFDLTKVEEQLKCFHYTNLQPLWKVDNISKGAKYDGVNYRNKKTKNICNEQN